MTLTPGTRLGPYEILSPLGAGGMGEVYRARDAKLGRDVALKILPEAFASDPERLARFEREAKTLAALNHPHIGQIYGFEQSSASTGIGQTVSALALELIEGPTLAERIAQGPIPLDEALPIARQIAEALEAAHEAGIIHRDLKPANIKVRPDGTVKVLDFGLAKGLEGAPEGQGYSPANSPTITSPAAMTRHGVILGTAAYMAPEQAKGQSADKRADIWGYGCVLYEMLTGRRAFPGESVTESLAGVLKGEPDWAALPHETPATIRRLLERCLEKDAKRRLRDIGEARVAIDQTAAEAGRRTVGPLTAMRASTRLSWGAAGAALGILLTGGVTWMARSGSEPATPMRLAIPLPAGAPLAIREGASSFALSPDGTELVYTAPAGGTYQLYRRSFNSIDATPIPGTEGAYHPFFSPDGRWVGFYSDQDLRKVPLAGGPATRISQAAAAWGATWATDGHIYIAQRWQGESLARVPADGGTPEIVSRPDAARGEASHRWPHAIPDTDLVLFTIGAGGSFDDARIAALDVKTGERRTLVEGGTSPRFAPPDRLVFARGGTLLALSFDPTTMTVSGTPAPIVDGVASNRANGEAQFAVTSSGAVAYVAGSTGASERSLAWVDRRGVVSPISAAARAYEDLSLSPDGRWLALTIEGPMWQVWVQDLERGTLTRMTQEHTNSDPLWSPDGTRIVFTSFRDGKYGLFWKAADGSGPEERLVTSDNFVHPYSFSPDGRFLAYSEQTDNTRGTGHDIWVLPIEGDRQPRLFLGTPAQEVGPAFSPDGRWIAYESHDSGRPEIYVQPFPGPGGGVQISTDGGTRASWARNGRELFYWIGADAARMMAVPIAADTTLKPGRPQRLFDLRVMPSGRPYDPAPDAQRFIVILPGDEGAPVPWVNLILNWR